jgi:Contractile injection system tube protein/LysM domain
MTQNGKLEKATLRVVAGSLKGRELKFTLNPTDLSLTRKARWAPGKPNPATKAARDQFQGVDPLDLKLSVLLDATEAGREDVIEEVSTLFAWLGKNHTADKEPPLLQLQWGSNTTLQDFHGYLSQVDVKYTLFKPDGAPIRATASLSFKELPPEGANDPGRKQNPTSGALLSGRAHVVTSGDSLPSLAYREYRDPTLWRVLAERNGIDDPLRLTPGTTLVIPHAADVDSVA